jgi:mannan endo-1,4-beta-mannosidase
MADTTMSRRHLLATVGVAGSLSGCSSLGETFSSDSSSGHTLSGEYTITDFVVRNGSTLELNGTEYRFSGMMALDLTRLDKGKTWINTAMSVAQEYDIDVFRCWGFSNSKTHASHTAPGEFDDTWLDLFDYTIAKAKEVGVRVIVPLLQGVHVDSSDENHAFAPSPAAYKNWSETADASSASGTKQFIEDDQANTFYKEYIRHVLTRENQYTNTEYRNEPTILAIECANELEYRNPDRVGRSLDFWYEDITSYIRSFDSNHLLSTGMHGSMGEIYEPWTERCAYVRDHMVDDIDICSFHDYPLYRAGEGGDAVQIRSEELARRYATHKIRLAKEEIGKPVYAGEYGATFNPRASVGYVTKLETETEASDIEGNARVPMKFPEQHDDGVLVRRKEDISGVDLDDRIQYFRNLTDVATEHDMDGIAFWTLAYDFRPDDATEEERSRHRIDHDDLITYLTDDRVLDTIRESGEEVATQ